MSKEQYTASEIDELIQALISDPRSATLEPRDRQMLCYAMKLTATPQDMESNDIELLRQVGLDDRAIHDLCCVTGYFAFVNRIADGLGVELESK